MTLFPAFMDHLMSGEETDRRDEESLEDDEEPGVPQSLKEFYAEMARAGSVDKGSAEERAQWADRMLEKLDKALSDSTLSDTAKEVLEETIETSHLRAQLAGMTLSTLLPPGHWRKVMMFGLLGVSVLSLVQGSTVFAIVLLLVSASFSPRIMGLAFLYMGAASGHRWLTYIGLGIIAWFTWGDSCANQEETRSAEE